MIAILEVGHNRTLLLRWESILEGVGPEGWADAR